MKDSIELSINVRATAAEIWGALTDSDELENWWSEDVKLEAKVGGAFREAWEDDEGGKQLASGKVISVTAKKSIIFSWREKDWPAGVQTQCAFLIEDQGKERTLTVKHEGWNSLPENKRGQLIKDFTVGWKYHLKELKAYLDD
ncbi:SRPBCC domain-containing protein [Bdellovibrio bacteriovorus]|uniref:SRPBCC family protein n=1 Tax=Bdellovibrio bacteriovorus TaxID=959 RepID=UPI0035A710F4